MILALLLAVSDPQATITSPREGDLVRGDLRIRVSITDDGSGIEYVAAYYDNNWVIGNNTTGNEGWSVFWASRLTPDITLDLFVEVGFRSRKKVKSAKVRVTVDNQAPQIRWVDPPKGAVGGTVNLQVDARDNDRGSGLRTVELQVDGAAAGAFVNGRLAWDTTKGAPGKRRLVATAVDRAGNTAKSPPLELTVHNAPPVVRLKKPAAGFVRGKVALEADASSPVGIARVRFFAGGVEVGPAWDTTGRADGPVELTARATDAAGNEATSPAVRVTIDNTPPTVSITAPAGGGKLRGAIPIAVTANDAGSGLDFVAILEGARELGRGVGFTWNTTAADDGPRRLTARAADKAGNEAVSAPVDIHVDNTPPSLPGRFRSTSHPDAIGRWHDPQSRAREIVVEWDASTDGPQGTGLEGYGIVRDRAPDTVPTARNLGAVTTARQVMAEDGSDFFVHLRPVDQAGNWGETAHLGPFHVDATPPAGTVMVQPSEINTGTVTVTVAITEAHSGLRGANPPAVQILFVGGATKPVTQTAWDAASRVWTGTVDVEAADARGTATVTATGPLDVAGNAMAAATETVRVDNAPGTAGWPLGGARSVSGGFGRYVQYPWGSFCHSGLDIGTAAGTMTVAVDRMQVSAIWDNPATATNIVFRSLTRPGVFYAYLHLQRVPAAHALRNVDAAGNFTAVLNAGNNVFPVASAANANSGFTHVHFTICGNGADFNNTSWNPLTDAAIFERDPGGNTPAIGPVWFQRGGNFIRFGAQPYLAGRIEVIAEVQDDLGNSNPRPLLNQNDPDAWPAAANRIRWGTQSVPFRMEYWVENAERRWEPYVHEFRNFVADAMMNLIYEAAKAHPFVVGGINENNSMNFTNLPQDRYWETRLRRHQPWNGAVAVDNREGEYPDGEYHVRLRAYDPAGRVTDQDVRVQVDNWAPFAARLTVRQNGRVKYEAGWKPNGARTGLELRPDADGRRKDWINGAADVEFEVEFSEPMQDSPSLSIRDRSGAVRTVALAETAGSRKRRWTGKIEKAALAGGDYDMAKSPWRPLGLTGLDARGNALDVEPADPAVRDAAGAMTAHQGAPSADWGGRRVDVQHRVKIDTAHRERPKFSLEAPAPPGGP